MRPPPNAFKFDIPDELWHVLRHFETQCVGGCCGRKAFLFDAASVASLKDAMPPEELQVAMSQLGVLIAELSATAGPVDTLMIMDEWNGRRAARWFAGIGRFLDRHRGVA
jgi:hypothetical protein